MLALLAGSGGLPAALAEGLAERPHVCALEGFLPDRVTPDRTFLLETLGSLIADLRARGITEVCFAGAMQRYPIDPSRIDAATMPLVPVIQRALAASDDNGLKAVIGIFEAAGLMVVGAHQLLPGLLPPEGIATSATPGPRDERDATRAAAILAAISGADIGQSVAVKSGQALAVEGIFGTDWMLGSLRARPDADDGGGIFFKAPKLDQDRRVDLPTIGPGTVAGVAAAGLSGLVIEAGGVMVLDFDAVARACDAAGLFLWVRGAGV